MTSKHGEVKEDVKILDNTLSTIKEELFNLYGLHKDERVDEFFAHNKKEGNRYCLSSHLEMEGPKAVEINSVYLNLRKGLDEIYDLFTNIWELSGGTDKDDPTHLSSVGIRHLTNIRKRMDGLRGKAVSCKDLLSLLWEISNVVNFMKEGLKRNETYPFY